jgi:hypothetical protein
MGHGEGMGTAEGLLVGLEPAKQGGTQAVQRRQEQSENGQGHDPKGEQHGKPECEVHFDLLLGGRAKPILSSILESFRQDQEGDRKSHQWIKRP